MKINNEKKKQIWTPFAPNLGGVLVPQLPLYPPKNSGRNAPLPEDTF